MKKVVLTLACATLSLFAGDVKYANAIKNVYLTSDAKASVGRLLPTSKVEILEKKGDVLKVKIGGFINPSAPYAVYFVPKKRILVTALKKSADAKMTNVGSEKDGYQEVSFEAYIKNDKLGDDLKALYTQGDKLFKANCALCHDLHPVKEFTANQWPSMVKAMITRTPLTKDEQFLMVEYLQKHANDM